MEFCSDKSPAKRRKLRKGTHSCQECRRRKVKCTYGTSDNVTCIMCRRRGAQCISQDDSPEQIDAVDQIDHVRNKPIVDDRLLVEDLEDANQADLTYAEKRRASRVSSPISEPVAVSISSVHPNTKEGGRHPHQIAGDFTLPEPQTHTTIRETLLRALPCKADLIILAERVSMVSAICYQSDYRAHSTRLDEMPKQPNSVRSLLQPERHPTLLARQMLLSAAAVQQLSPKEVVPGLTKHQHVIMKQLAESAIKFVNMDDALLGTLEGLENLIFEIFYHIDCGNIRRAWITSRRAVTAAQMLGLHRPGHHRFMLIKDEGDHGPEVMWSTIVSMERMLSLLLGFPTSTSNMALVFHTITKDSPLGHNLSTLVGTLAAKILERNQMHLAQQMLDTTGEIDREIILAAEQMPSEFWRPLAFVGFEQDSLKALMETRRAFGHMCYYILVVQLHLPHMLNPHNASQRVYSKIACVNASREILTREIELRTFNPISARCRMTDFLALISGMALMLGYITSRCGNERDHLLAHQRLGDRATVERVLDCIDPMSDLHGDAFAVRCAALLRDLLAFEDDVARQHSLRASQPYDMQHSQGNQRDVLIMRVPYLGSIQISQEGVAALPAAKLGEAPSHSEDITIGGIGSMRIGQPHASDSGPPTAPASGTHDSSQAHPTTLTGSPTRLDLMFPDAAASFDDWVFQGVDTAFMETLMRGSAVPLPDDLGDKSWDISTFP